MRRAAWLIFGGVISLVMALVTAQMLEDRRVHQEWLNSYGKRGDW